MRIVTILFLAVLIFSCQEENEFSKLEYSLPNVSDITKLVSEVNTKSNIQSDALLASFSSSGNLVSYVGFTDGDQVPFLKIIFSKKSKGKFERDAILTVMLDGIIEFPSQINDARMTFLQNQVLVEDLQTGFAKTFYVRDGITPNLIPDIPVTDCPSLKIQKGPSIKGQKIDTACSCSCKRCFGSNNCGSSSASCSCSGDTQSITCREGYNAECTSCK